MRRVSWMLAMCVTVVMVLGWLGGDVWAQQKKLVYWTHWEQNPDFNKWYETKGKEFAKKSG
ncbi:MAG TPA: hypothetical protein VN203_09585, partial [Candidatus Acidoferrum sp.]|nr:hypothetical protein [Candidatus Acidoferrum sp.]